VTGTAGAALADVLREGARRLAAAGVATPRADVELLLAHVLAGAGATAPSRGEVQAMALRGTELAPGTVEAARDLVARRARRVPLQHLTGTATFRGLTLAVGPGVFVPRPETEVLAGLAVEAAASLTGPGGEGAVVVDLCTGSGAVALAVATEVPAARVVAVEREPAAHAWARRNVEALRGSPDASDRSGATVDLRLGDAAGADTGVLADLAGLVDVVVSNPPYIPDGARPVDPEVAEHDPAAALYGGGPDGLGGPRAVVAAAAGLLRPGGLLLMEHADVQGAATRALVPEPGWHAVLTVPDLTGRDRVLVARRQGAQ